jgi:uncharacterized membrane protein YjjP (DUF1212 family)
VGIHWILPFTPVNQHDETRIIVASLVLGAAFLVLSLGSYRNAASSFAVATGLLVLVIAVSAATGASPLREGAVVKALFVGVLAWATATVRWARGA